MLLETQIGSTSVSEAFFLHHPLGLDTTKLVFFSLLSLPHHKKTIQWSLSGFFYCLWLSYHARNRAHCNHGSRVQGAEKSSVFPKNKHISDLSPMTKLRTTTIHASLKKRPNTGSGCSLATQAVWKGPGNPHMFGSARARWAAVERISCNRCGRISCKQWVSHLWLPGCYHTVQKNSIMCSHMCVCCICTAVST